MKLDAITNTNTYRTQHGYHFKVHLLTLNTSYSQCTFESFLLKAENIYNDEDPEGAADSEVQA